MEKTPRPCLRYGLGCLFVAVLFLFGFYGLYFILRGPLPPDVQLIAHRGGPVYKPENTIAAFNHAIDLGVNWIEFDVQRTQDGVLVVFHDETVDRTTDGVGSVKDLTFEQIRALDAGDGETVPTFEEIITLAREAGVGILPEAKSPHLYPGLEVEMVNAILSGKYQERTIIQSFDEETLERIKDINPEMGVCPLYGLWKLELRNPQPADAKVLCPMAEMVLLNPWMIKQAHRDNREVYIWFGIIENPTIMRVMLAFGADGLMVDDTVILAEILER
jgi:glycerophosphoryl diester phosphodiesterase